MSTIPHTDLDCQEEIPFDTGPIFRLATVTPWENPLADLLAASYRNGDIDAAGADAMVMSYEEWRAQVPTHDYIEC